MLKLYDAPVSGNCHKVRMLLAFLNIEHELIPVNLPNGEQKSEQHLARHPLGRVPAIDDDGVIVWDSQAILVYLARKFGTDAWYPSDPIDQSSVQSWLSFAALEIMEGPTYARAAVKFKRDFIDLKTAHEKSHAAFAALDGWLKTREWLACDHITIADLAVYPYCGLSWEGNLDVSEYTNLCAWMSRIEAMPGYIGMENLPKP